MQDISFNLKVRGPASDEILRMSRGGRASRSAPDPVSAAFAPRSAPKGRESPEPSHRATKGKGHDSQPNPLERMRSFEPTVSGIGRVFDTPDYEHFPLKRRATWSFDSDAIRAGAKQDDAASQ